MSWRASRRRAATAPAMRDDLRSVEVRVDEHDAERWRRAAAEAEQQIAELRAELAELTSRRAYDRMMRDSWQEQCLRDAGMRAIAERRAAESQRLLDVARDLLAAWSACHDDPGLARRTDLLLDEIDRVGDEIL
jgi:hypothetical protein